MARTPTAATASTSSGRSPSLRAIAFDRVDPEAWNALVEGSAEAWLFHRREWLEIEASQGGVRANLSFAVVADDGGVVGVQPLYLRENGLGSWIERSVDSGLHRHTGFALRRGLAASAGAAARELAMCHVREIAVGAGADRIQLNVQNLAPARLLHDEIPFWVTRHGYELGLQFGPNGIRPEPGRSTACADQVLELEDRGEDELFRGLDPACRRAVRKGIKSGLTVHLDDDPWAIADYFTLARLSAARTGESLPPLAFYQGIYAALRPDERCRILFAGRDGSPVGALFLLVDKGAVHFLAGASDPAALAVRVNDFMHWSAIRWAREQGQRCYRLGPTFPDLPLDWPVARVSRFKGKFGARSVPVLQGSCFLHPEKYVERASPGPRTPVVPPARTEERTSGLVWLGREDRAGIEVILRTCGLPSGALDCEPVPDAPVSSVVLALERAATGLLPVSVHDEPGGVPYLATGNPGWFLRPVPPAYHAVLPHLSFSGAEVRPVWRNAFRRAAVAWHVTPGRRDLLVGVDPVNETVRHRQGDPSQVEGGAERAAFGFDFERPNYLFARQLLARHPTQPWADRLGYLLAEACSTLTGCPLLEPLPRGARGAVILTGDDDQAFLETYAAQNVVVDGLPMTYMLHHLTRHSSATVQELPASVEIGLHPDALDRPDEYDRLCEEQAALIREKSGRPVRVVRNHGYLSRGYLGHLPAWEKSGLALDVNLPGLDGTALNGSFLPMLLRRPDGSWSRHYSLLTAFGDGMLFALGLSERQAARRVRRLALQIEADRPGVLVFNLHPQNIDRTRRLHEAAKEVARRPGWVALGLEAYLDWLETLADIRARRHGRAVTLSSPRRVDGLVLRIPGPNGWTRRPLPEWSGSLELVLE